MNTQTQPSLREPEIPSNVALDTENNSQIDVCVQNNSFQVQLVHVYIRNMGEDISPLLEGAEDLESRIFEGMRPQELRMRFRGLTTSLTPLINIEKKGAYLLEYQLEHKDKVYDAVRRL